MKKLISLIKNGQTYQLGDVSQADLQVLDGKITANTQNIASVSAETTANTVSIGLINAALEDIYTKAQTDSAITEAIGAIDKEIFEFVTELPTEDIKTNKIYVVPNADSTEDGNTYTEYLYNATESKWEIVGNFKADTDLSNIYVKSEVYNKTEIDNLLTNLERAEFYTQEVYNALATKNPYQLYGIYVEVND